jgi:hypothetical protein
MLNRGKPGVGQNVVLFWCLVGPPSEKESKLIYMDMNRGRGREVLNQEGHREILPMDGIINRYHNIQGETRTVRCNDNGAVVRRSNKAVQEPDSLLVQTRTPVG